MDVANALDFSAGWPPSVAVPGSDSLGEQIQRACPDARVVKTLNTMRAEIMVDPGLVAGHHDVFLSGDDPGAKGEVRALLHAFDWPDTDILDLGGIVTARGVEHLLPLWLNLFGLLDNALFNLRIVR